MSSYILDTHTWSWSLISSLLPQRVSEVLDEAAGAQISAISLYEIRQKVRLGKWDQMAAHASNLQNLLDAQGIRLVAVTAEIADLAGALEWDHRDPFDRMLVAQARIEALPLATDDAVLASFGVDIVS